MSYQVGQFFVALAVNKLAENLRFDRLGLIHDQIQSLHL